eukprot:561025-Hanusia_phi.AAC.1
MAIELRAKLKDVTLAEVTEFSCLPACLPPPPMFFPCSFTTYIPSLSPNSRCQAIAPSLHPQTFP